MAVRSGRGPAAPAQAEADGDRAVPALVGRDDELAAVVDALGGPPAVVLVEGEAGIGKTRLLREALTADELGDQTVLVAACPPLVEPFPLGPIVDGLRRLRPDVAALGLTALGGALRPLFPEWAHDLPPVLEALDDPRETRHRVLAALTELVGRLGVGVLVVEDAHWADTVTLEWLLTLITNEPAVGDRAMSLVVTYRPHDVPAGSLLLRLTSRVPPQWNTKRIELDLFDVEQTRHVVGSMLGADEVSEDFAAFLHERTDGLPLAVEEMIRLLRERHDIIRRHGSWSRKVLDELEVPPTLRDSVLERMARLPAAARRVLEAAAVLGAPADDVTLAAVAGLSESSGRKGMAGAFAAALLQEIEPGLFVFRHVLDAQAVAEAVPASERRRLHARAAARLCRREPTPVVRLAMHYREAGEAEEWCRYAEAAADLALESGDDHASVVILTELLTATGHPPDRAARLARKLGIAAVLGAAPLGEFGAKVKDAIRAVLDDEGLPPGGRGEIRLLLGRLLVHLGDMQSGYEEIEAAIPDLGDRPAMAARAMVSIALPYVPGWPAARHEEWLTRGAELLGRVESAEDRLHVDVIRASALLGLGKEAGWQTAEELPRSGSTQQERQYVVVGLLNVAQWATVWGRFYEARWRLDTASELTAAIGYGRLARAIRLAQARLAWYTGQWEGLAEKAADLADADDARRTDVLEARQLHGLLDLATGSRNTAGKLLREVCDEFTRRGLVAPEATAAMAARGRLHLADGAVEDALNATESAMDMIAQKGVWVWAGDIAPVHVDALLGVGRLDAAQALVEELSAALRDLDAPAPAAALVTCRALVAEGRGDQIRAAALFADAAAAWAVLPRPYDELLTLERRGMALLAADARYEALELLSEVEQRLRDLGATWDADRVAHVLRSHGVEIVRTWRRGPQGYGDELSPRELDVVRLAARGMTNKQIGERLYISHRTVGQHLSGAMRKLDVSSRTALVMAASQAGLLPTEVDDES